jgi:DNA-directed RNA polymerase subunit RPC12/RpoP
VFASSAEILLPMMNFLPYEVHYNMCFVDSSAADSVDLSAAAMTRYECSACGNRFKGMGSKLSCPACQSTDLKKLD